MNNVKNSTFTSKMASKKETEFNITVSLRSTGKEFTKEELEVLKDFEVDDYMKSDMVKAVQDGVFVGEDKATVDNVKLQIQWTASAVK